MSLKIYIDGKLYDKEDAKISVYDHGLLYGDGVFEGIRSYGGKVFRLAEHLDRLWDSAKAIWLEIPMTKAGDGQGHRTTRWPSTASRTATSAWWSRAASARWGSIPTGASDPQVIIIADKIALYPEELYQKGLEIVTVSVARNHPAALEPADQVAQLPEQHPGEDRGAAGGLHRGPDAQPQGRSGRMHRRQHLPGPPAAGC